MGTPIVSSQTGFVTGSATLANPLFLTVGLLAIVAIGMSFDALQTPTIALLVLILLGLLLGGYGQIHTSFVSLGAWLNGRTLGGATP